MIKVLWVTNSFGLGGAERQIVNMGSALKDKGIEIDVVYYSNEDSRMLESSKVDLNVIFIDKDRLGRFKFVLELRKLIKEENYDIVHAFGGGTANFYARYSAFFTKTKIVVGAMLGKKHFASIRSKIVNSIANLRSNYWTVNNEELIPILINDLKFINKNRIHLLNNGYPDRDNINYKEHENTFYDKLKGNNKVFITVGRLAKVKNNVLFVKSALKVIKKVKDVQFWIIGDGPMYNDIFELIEENHAQEKIKLLGFRSDVDIALSRADFYVLTSFTEGSPNAMAEAMRAKKPLISTKCTSLKQFIVENKNGISVDVDNENQLINAMLTMLSKKEEELQKMGELSYDLFKSNFEENKVIKEFEDLYNDLLGGASQ